MSPLFLTLIFLLISPFLSTPTTNNLTAYDIIQTYNFPVGLLPNGVTGYEINTKTGQFKVFLKQTCKFKIEGYELEYKSTISGVIARNKITNLKGVSVKVLFLWLNIVEIDRDDDEISFSVGIASANFPLDGFDESPTCGCGFDCVNRMVSSY